MRSILYVVIALLVLSCSAEDSKSRCTDLTPDNTPWLNDLKNTMTNCSCELSLIRGNYNGDTVFFIDMTDGLCNGYMAVALYNCHGRVVRSFVGPDYINLYANVDPEELLYICSE